MDSAMNMNIDTLLEAAIFLEKRSATRGPDGNQDQANTNEEEASNPSLSPGEDFKERRRAGGAGTREVHNKLEKNRRAHLKECFEQLKQQIPSLDDKRTSNLSILRCSLRYIQMLKRKEKEFEQEMARLALEKIVAQERINTLKRELTSLNLEVDIKLIMSQTNDGDTASVSTATAHNESPIVSDVDEEDDTDAPMPAAPPEDGGESPRPHVPVTATLPAIQPAIQPPLTTLTSKQVAVNASSTPLVLTPVSQSTSHQVMAMPTARALTNMCKMVSSGGSSSMVTLPAGVATSNMASSHLMTAVAASSSPVTTSTSSSSPHTTTTTAAAFKTPVNQILQQTIAQRALAQHLQQHQVRLQQQPPNPHTATIPAAKVITVQRPAAVRPLTHLRQAVTMNQLMPSLIGPGTSILTAPASLHASNQVAALAALTKIPTPTSSSVTATAAMSQSPGNTSTATTPVTFTTMKQFLAPSHLQGMVSLGAASSQIPTFGQLVSQTVGRTAVNPTTVNVAVTPVAGPTNPGSSTVNMAVTPVATTSVSSLASLTAAQAAHPVITSLAHVNPMTQLVSPVNMVSPAGITPHFSQAQLSVVNSPILRSIGHIPIQLQQPINIGQIVKPVVMVTMPSVVTTSAPSATVQVQVPVTQS